MEKILKSYFVRIMKHHPRFYSSILFGLVVAFLSSYFGVTSSLTQAILGYVSTAIIYIWLAIILINNSTSEKMHSRALSQDDGKYEVLFLVALSLVFSVSVIFADLANVKYLQGTERYEKITLALLTIISSWFFSNTVFALHYAHDYFFDLQDGKSGGLVFLPAGEEPEYLDFLYFSFVLGATAQTADVTVASKKMRRTCTLHSILAFFFNTALLALTVNMAASLV